MAPPPQSTAGAATPVAAPEQLNGEVPSPEQLNGKIELSSDHKENAAHLSPLMAPPPPQSTAGAAAPLLGKRSCEVPSPEIDLSSTHKKKSAQEVLELMDRLDPSGFVSCMALVSVIYALVAPWLLWRAGSALFWTSSSLACSYLFLWTISLSTTMPVHTAFVRATYGPLLAVAAAHLVGPLNGVVVMYLATFFAVGVLGYAVAEHCERVGIDSSVHAVATPSFCSEDHRRRYEGEAFLFRFLASVTSLPVLAHLACVVILFPDARTNLSDAMELVITISAEACVLCVLGATYLTLFELRGALLSMETMLFKVMSCYCVGLLLAVLLSYVLGDAAAAFILWLLTVPSVGYFGYALAIRRSYRQILARNLEAEAEDTNLSRELDERY